MEQELIMEQELTQQEFDIEFRKYIHWKFPKQIEDKTIRETTTHWIGLKMKQELKEFQGIK